ncbi:endolytic transglycosylase MltG [Kordiimonas aquimaris]|uniref:endolytic transglycosylase MltG n=1 Tax=Kordiimonas aquimaris TaxID=707591 RepID=UPI0021D34DB1|nr:endolytic transglycosylase MltG [Kordiimonas aquimaris]
MNKARLTHTAAILIVSGLISLITAYGYVNRIANEPGDHSSTFLIYLEAGDTLSTVADYASLAGVVDSPWQLKLIAYVSGLQNKIYAGEYEVLKGLSPRELMQKIADQQTYKRRLVIPEGSSVKQVAAILSSSFGVDMTGFELPVEGSLLPETYFYERGVSANELTRRMQDAMKQAFNSLWKNRAMNLPFMDQGEAITLASIVEKETAQSTERDKVAAVFVNRLRLGMRLQSDPTIIYGITAGMPLGRPISRSDLRGETPYNTYRRDGLPPTAISNPGLASLTAVLNPADVPYLYFVADGTGGHAFAETLEEHNRNVARWRQIEKNNN